MITGIYDLVADSQWRNVQLQEVFLECDTTDAPVTINLFPIMDLNRFWNVKIVVSDVNNNAATNNITINAGGVLVVDNVEMDSIDENNNTQIILNNNGESVVFQAVSERQWLAESSLGCSGDTYKTGIVDDVPFVITPSIVKTCTSVIDTPAFPTALPINLQGYKIGGCVALFGENSYGIYLGTVEIDNLNYFPILPFTTTGTVTAISPAVGIGTGTYITTPLGLYNSVIASDMGIVSVAQINILTFFNELPQSVAYDIVMFVDSTPTPPIEGNIEAVVSFEFEFLLDATLTPIFTFNPTV